MDRRSFLKLRSSKPVAPLGIRSGLETYSAPLEAADVKHALRRSAFAALTPSVESWVGRTASELADSLVDQALAAPMPDTPDWAMSLPPGRGATQDERRAYNRQNRAWVTELRVEWLSRMSEFGLAERMTYIWHNHFVTGISKYRWAVVARPYLNTLRTYALGNFKDFVRAIGMDPAMLIYLDGVRNRRGAPNENYARELMELFTMGPVGPDGSPNYTEEDIQELARALTGWQVDDGLQANFNFNRFDGGQKTIFGQTGDFGYLDAVNLLFDERGPQIAHFVCRHLYESLVFAAPDEDLVAQLADIFVASGYELAPVVRTLLASAHFYDVAAQGAQIKSPVEHTLGLTLEAGLSTGPDALGRLHRLTDQLGQELLDPPNVAGWPGHHDWINTTTLPYRWIVSESLLSPGRDQVVDLVPMAEGVHDPADPEAAFRLPLAIAEHFLPVPTTLLDVPDISDGFGGDLANFPVPSWVESAPPQVRNLAKLFLGGAPWYEWNLYAPGANDRISSFVRLIAQYPEFQLA